MTNPELEHLLLQIQEQTMRTQDHPQVRLDRICALIADAGALPEQPAQKASEESSRKPKR